MPSFDDRVGVLSDENGDLLFVARCDTVNFVCVIMGWAHYARYIYKECKCCTLAPLELFH